MRPNNKSSLNGYFPKDMSLTDAFECLFENAPDAIYILDTHGRFVVVNRKAEELTGFKREDYIGKPFRKVITTKSLPKAIRGFLSVIRGKSIMMELEISVKSLVDKGTTFTITVPIKPELEEGGEKIWVRPPESLLSTTTKA